MPGRDHFMARRIRRIAASAAMVVAWGVFAPGVVAQTPSPRPAKSASNNPAKRTPPIFTPAREAAALTFVGQNHPELRKLLLTLKTSDEKAYHAAVRQIFADSERLAQILAQDPDLHALEVELWQARSRIDLLIARIEREPTIDPAQEKRLRTMVERQFQIEMRIARHQIRRAETELEQRKSALDQRERASERIVGDRMKQALKKREVPTPSSPGPTPEAKDVEPKEKSPMAP